MLGAIIGDIVGSRFEWSNIKHKNFELLTPDCFVTDDSIMTLAVAQAIMNSKGDLNRLPQKAIESMQTIGRPYPACGYGGRFFHWIYSDDPKPYNSFGNGAAMRVSPCGYAASSLEEAMQLAHQVTCVSHNHPEGLKGAEATAVAIYMARTGSSKETIRQMINDHYYPLNFSLDEIRPLYRFNETCQHTVPQAIEAFLESDSFEDALRNAVSLGGDSDTLAAITGGIAQAYYGIPPALREAAQHYLDKRLHKILLSFEETYPASAK